MTAREFHKLTIEQLEKVQIPNYDIVPPACQNTSCPLWDGKCGQAPKSINQLFNQAISNYIKEYYDN